MKLKRYGDDLLLMTKREKVRHCYIADKDIRNPMLKLPPVAPDLSLDTMLDTGCARIATRQHDLRSIVQIEEINGHRCRVYGRDMSAP